jgi:hypothetical protein
MAAYIAAKKAQVVIDNAEPMYKGTLKRSYFQANVNTQICRNEFERRSIIKRTISSRSKYVSDAKMQAYV